MPRLKASGNFPPPRTPASLLAGALIGGAVMSLAAGAMILGSSMAIQDAARKPGRGF